MTITEIHENPALLAEYLGKIFDELPPLLEYGASYRRTRKPALVEETQEEKTARAWQAYLLALDQDWLKSKNNPHKFQCCSSFHMSASSRPVGWLRHSAPTLSPRVTWLRPPEPQVWAPVRVPPEEGPPPPSSQQRSWPRAP